MLGLNFQNMFRRSGLDEIEELYTQPEPEQQDYSYKRGPAGQAYLDFVSAEPQYQGPSIWQRIAAGLAGVGAKDPMLTHKLLNEPYERARQQHIDKAGRLKSAADYEEKEADNQRQASNYKSMADRRIQRGQHETRESVRRINDSTARGVRADELQAWRASEKDQDQAGIENRFKAGQAATESRFKRGQAATESRFNRSQDRLRQNDQEVNVYEQQAIDKAASDQLAKEFANSFDIQKDPATGKILSRTLKADVDDETAAQIEQRHAAIKNEIVNKTKSNYEILQDPTEEVEEVPDEDTEGEDLEFDVPVDHQRQLQFWQWMMNMGKKLGG
jgi:hypothetical protein